MLSHSYLFRSCISQKGNKKKGSKQKLQKYEYGGDTSILNKRMRPQSNTSERKYENGNRKSKVSNKQRSPNKSVKTGIKYAPKEQHFYFENNGIQNLTDNVRYYSKYTQK